MTNPQQPQLQYDPNQERPFHGQEYQGYWYDANFGQWKLINPDETIAGKQEAPSKKVLVGFGVGMVGAVVVGIGIANWVAEDPAPAAPVVVAQMTPAEEYIRDYKAAGYYNEDGDDEVIDAGIGVCVELASGSTRTQVINVAYRNNRASGSGLDRDDLEFLVGISIQHFCPEQG